MVEMIPATEAHAEALAALMTPEDQADLARLGGAAPADVLRDGVRRSVYAFCALDDAVPLALGGVVPVGGVLSSEGLVWLVTQPEATARPIRFLREAKRQVAIMRGLFPVLRNFERVGKENSRHWIEWLGFQFGPEMQMNGMRVRPIEARTWA